MSKQFSYQLQLLYLLDEEKARDFDGWFMEHSTSSFFATHAGHDYILPVELLMVEERECIEKLYSDGPVIGIRVTLEGDYDPLTVLLDAQRSGNYSSCLLSNTLLLIPKDEFQLRLARYFLENGPGEWLSLSKGRRE